MNPVHNLPTYFKIHFDFVTSHLYPCVLRHPQSLLFYVSCEVAHPYEITGKVMGFYILIYTFVESRWVDKRIWTKWYQTFHEFNHSLHNWSKNIFGTEVVQESNSWEGSEPEVSRPSEYDNFRLTSQSLSPFKVIPFAVYSLRSVLLPLLEASPEPISWSHTHPVIQLESPQYPSIFPLTFWRRNYFLNFRTPCI